MAMLSDPGAFSKGAEKQDAAMKGLGIEKTDAKTEEKKKKEEEAKASKWIYFIFRKFAHKKYFLLHLQPRNIILIQKEIK